MKSFKSLLLLVSAANLVSCACCDDDARLSRTGKPSVSSTTSVMKSAAAATPQGQAASAGLGAASALKSGDVKGAAKGAAAASPAGQAASAAGKANEAAKAQ